MGTMIPYDSLFMKAIEQSRAMDSSVTPPYHPGLYKYGSQPEGDPGRVQAMNTEYMDLGAMAGMRDRNLNGMQGGEGGNMRSYVPQQDAYNMSLVPPTTYDPNAAPEPTPAPAPVPEQPAQGGGIEQQKAEVEQVAQYGDIPQLLDALRKMASMEPGQGGNPVFQLDEMYKNSSATQGIPGTVAQYPTAGGITRETDYNL